MLNTPDLREQIHSYVEQLSPDRLVVALDFLSYLVDRDSNDATSELLAIPGLAAELQLVEEDVKAGELIDWRTIRDDV